METKTIYETDSPASVDITLDALNDALRNGTATIEATVTPPDEHQAPIDESLDSESEDLVDGLDKQQQADRVLLDNMRFALNQLNVNKPRDRSPRDRQFAATMTILEDAIARFAAFVIMKLPSGA